MLRNLIAACQNLEEINLKGLPIFGNLFYMELALMPFLRYVCNVCFKQIDNALLLEKLIFQVIDC